MSTGNDAGNGEETPDLDVRVLRGVPTDEELAAVLAVLHAVTSAPRERPTAQPTRRTAWDASRRDLRTTLPDTWR